MAGTGGTKDLSDLNGLSESELLSIPEENLPASLLPEFLERREEALQKKEAADGGDEQFRLTSENREKEHTALNDERARMSVEAYESEMREFYGREDVLLENLDREEKRAQKELSEIDSRALKLRDGRLAYVGSNGTYVDQQGQLLQGKDAAEAQTQNQLNRDAATWAERSATEQKVDDAKQMRQNILNMQAQQKDEDRGVLSGSKMTANLSVRGAEISRYETDFAEEFQSKSAATTRSGASITNAAYGGDDYMAAYGQPGASLISSFAPAADPLASSGSNSKPQVQPQTAPVPALSR